MVEWTEIDVGGDLILRLAAAPEGLCAIRFQESGRQANFLDDGEAGGRHFSGPEAERNDGNPVLVEALRQLRAYFAGSLKQFRLPLDMAGTDFQMRVWRELLKIPYGQTRSYMQIAEAIGCPGSVRAVGAANGANPIPIVVPCHRVIGASGKLVGYGGGLELKKRLLQMENGVAQLPFG